VKAEDLPFFIGLMEHLAQRGVTCPQPVRNRAGSALGELAGRPATVVTFLDGLWIRRPNVRRCGEVGEALARRFPARFQLENVRDLRDRISR
jgi:homoserine kinase type II